MKIGQNGTYKHVWDVLMKNTPPTGGDVRKMNARYVQKVNVRSDSEQKMRRREKLQKIFSANISLNISVIYSCEKKKHSRRTAICPIVLCAHTSNQV